jgi:hypothetical protein
MGGFLYNIEEGILHNKLSNISKLLMEEEVLVFGIISILLLCGCRWERLPAQPNGWGFAHLIH